MWALGVKYGDLAFTVISQAIIIALSYLQLKSDLHMTLMENKECQQVSHRKMLKLSSLSASTAGESRT